MPFIPTSVLRAVQTLKLCSALNPTSCKLLLRLSKFLTMPSQTSIPDPGRIFHSSFPEMLECHTDHRVHTRGPYHRLGGWASCAVIFRDGLREWLDAVHSHSHSEF